MLGDTFVLELDRHRRYPFRLAGTRLCALFGRELKGESFIGLWQQPGQTAHARADRRRDEEKTGVVASVTGATADDRLLPVNLEMLLLPLAHSSRNEARVVGALAPLADALLARRQVGRAIDTRHVPASRRGGRDGEAAAVPGRRRAHPAWPDGL